MAVSLIFENKMGNPPNPLSLWMHRVCIFYRLVSFYLCKISDFAKTKGDQNSDRMLAWRLASRAPAPSGGPKHFGFHMLL